MKPIYKPKGRAGEYGDYAVNIYTGCNHGCVYCYAAKNAHRWGKDFTHVEARPGIVEAVKRQLQAEKLTGKLIHLCFTCDPYPAPPVDTIATREVIKAIKDSGNNVQILTKGGFRAERDFDLLGLQDWFGVTVTGYSGHEPGAASVVDRINTLRFAKSQNINTWISFEPVYTSKMVYEGIKCADYIDLFKIGKLNYYPSDINWDEFGRMCEALCKEYGRNYYIKEDLRRKMEANGK